MQGLRRCPSRLPVALSSSAVLAWPVMCFLLPAGPDDLRCLPLCCPSAAVLFARPSDCVRLPGRLLPLVRCSLMHSFLRLLATSSGYSVPAMRKPSLYMDLRCVGFHQRCAATMCSWSSSWVEPIKLHVGLLVLSFLSLQGHLRFFGLIRRSRFGPRCTVQ